MIIIQEEIQEINRLAAEAIIDMAQNISNSKGFITLALPGGKSVKGIYQEFKKIEDPIWKKIQIFMVDERLVEITHEESNFKHVWESFASTLVKKNILPMENLHPVKMDEDHGINNYQKILDKYGGHFDIVLLAAGEDGHIASLFPDNKALKIPGMKYIYVDDSPKLPAERISASIELIHNSKLLVLLFIGESKRNAFNNFNNPHIPVLDCPAKIAIKMKNSIVYTDLK